jgi:nucleotide-binding universal stress UspA family protein
VIGDIQTVVNSVKEKHNIDMMVIKAHRRHWELYSSTPSFSDQVIKNIKSPLLVWKSSKEIKKIIITED